MKASESIKLFLQQPQIAVVGISRNKNKFGNAVYSSLKKKGIKVYPVNPHMTEFDGVRCFHSIETLPPDVKAIFVNTPPESTLKVVKIAINKGIQHMWLQQGTTDDTVINFLQGKDINYIADRCIMMFAQPVGHIHRFHRFLSKLTGNFPQ
jgi:predicted CoA-binding protein